MSGPGEGADFAERLDWLLSNVARVPGTKARLSTEAVHLALAQVSTGIDSALRARQWLTDMRAGRAQLTEPRSRSYITALEDMFRLPRGYFLNEQIQHAADDRITFADAVSDMRVIGPCHTLASEISLEDLHRIHVRIATLLRRDRTAS